MAYKRKRSFTKRPMKRKVFKPKCKIGKNSFAVKVKKFVMKVVEPKSVRINWDKVELFHNVWTGGANFQINISGAMPTIGTLDNQRIGDRIEAQGFKIRMLMGQKADRPNVNWRYIVYSMPKGQPTGYSDVFTNTTAVVLLDEPNTA